MGNRVALVTGGSRGIGRACVFALAKGGYDIAIVYASNASEAEKTRLEAEEFGVRAAAYACDVSDFDAVKALVEAIGRDLGPVAVLVNNAGITNDKLLLQMSESDYSRVLDVNLKSAFHLIRHCYGGFLRARWGRIINIASVAGIMGNAGQANYAAAKAGMFGLTKSIAKELAGRGVTCNAIAPGLIETDMTSDMNTDKRRAILDAIPQKRAGSPGDVAELAAFLASDRAAYITGAVIPVDGGMSM